MTVKRRILLVDDDSALRAALAEQLGLNAEFDITEAGTARAARDAVTASGPFDAILLDVGLPDMDGRELCRALRQDGVTTPVLMLTAADGEADTILGLDAGANDYVTKPFKFGVLLARLRAHLRQHDASEDAVFTLGPYNFRPGSKLLIDRKTARKVRLTEKEAAVLRYLYRAGRKVIARETLLHEVWGYNSGVTTHTLETHVYRLRQKIESDPARATLLLTEPGGYRLEP